MKLSRDRLRRFTFIYLAAYLLTGGLGFLLYPDLTLGLMLSDGAYGDVMPRVVGMFMLVLGGFIIQFVLGGDYRYYVYAIRARVFIVFVLTTIYFRTRDPLFVVLDVIVLVGLLPSIYVSASGTDRSRREG